MLRASDTTLHSPSSSLSLVFGGTHQGLPKCVEAFGCGMACSLELATAVPLACDPRALGRSPAATVDSRSPLLRCHAEYFYPSDSDTTQTAAVHMTDLNTSLDHIFQHASRVGSHKPMALPKALAFAEADDAVEVPGVRLALYRANEPHQRSVRTLD